ncbi:MAG: hypothetical protein O7D86_14025 [Proteobacteria bacterium]|nr:hypothetical protein [Pseudomonadota bacterium]
MVNILNVTKKTQVILHDQFMAVLAWELAWWSRFNLDFPFPDWQISIHTIPLLLLVQGAIFWCFHLYRGLWRFASLPDLWNIFRASILGGLCFTLSIVCFVQARGCTQINSNIISRLSNISVRRTQIGISSLERS